jgi:flagellum-specific ATP synthase/type III secretion protein N (ATPase)
MYPSEKKIDFAFYQNQIKKAQLIKVTGLVKRVIGLLIEVTGMPTFIGEVCQILVPQEQQPVLAEVVGFRERSSLLMPLGELKGICPGCSVVPTGKPLLVKAGNNIRGRVLDGLGQPLDGKSLDGSLISWPIDNRPPNPLTRLQVSEILVTGVKAIDALLTCGKGQRIGIFSGSGVGKSTLLGMIARHASAEINVIALVGERGREVNDFIRHDLGEEGLARSIVVAATSDQPALVRLKAAFVASAIAEYFREQGQDVLLLMDSITRFAMAQREVGLTVGEPPATKGYPPSVFALLPRLLERTGMGEEGSITAFYTVLVEGDDFNEPIADTVRSILDGHIVLTRDLAKRNHYPAIDILQSVSRLMPEVTSPRQQKLAARFKDLLAVYKQAEDLINIGAYVSGSNKKIDASIRLYDQMVNFLCQEAQEFSSFEETIAGLESLGLEET